MLQDLDELVLLARSPVTLGLFAEFLRRTGYGGRPVRRGLNDPWIFEPNGEIRIRDGREQEPVTGISLEDAHQFLDWLSGHYELSGPHCYAQLVLPTPDLLQRAMHGGSLEYPPADGGGAYGHRHLTGQIWQMTERTLGVTSRSRERELLVFGGAKSLGDNTPGSVQKSLERVHPDYCLPLHVDSAVEHLGFRICTVIRPIPQPG